ncbi:ATP-dependent RNA helicase RhlE [Legionella norrlandica]|uniref:DEAD-box ATP-dependent RNA helicase RhpA n=1 Tax=Legionella norrlandica TaxID=1498499 RepID=A0A0A2T9K0_9GAMM|nr:DEAD/DEAH box helicase [Legionella norrlandica]KGP64098.1 ATP-dependent RNA helicase RhlE [Legionella norrlandica]
MSFAALGLIDPLVQAISKLGYTEPTPIQSKAIPVVLSGYDLLASAQTGTGKTAGFVLPVLQQLSQKPRTKNNRVKVLILTPTRELAAQVYENTVQFAQNLTIRSAVVYGGVKINPQMMKLRPGVEILVATPGRLLDLHQQRALSFDEVDTLILDEADRMLDMGFIHDIKKIIKLMPLKRQNLMFSATFSEKIRSLAKSILRQPVEIDVAPRNTSAIDVKQIIHPVDKNRKSELLCHLIHKNKWKQTLVFSRTKHGANRLVKQLAENHIHSVAIHGNKSQAQRTKALTEFKSGEVHILVATDIAARGIDIDKLPCVVNFDLPQVPEDYVHRIGRTGRAGAFGTAVSLVSADESHQLQAIEKLIKRKLERVEIDDFEPMHRVPASEATIKKSAYPSRKKSGFLSKQKSKLKKPSSTRPKFE